VCCLCALTQTTGPAAAEKGALWATECSVFLFPTDTLPNHLVQYGTGANLSTSTGWLTQTRSNPKKLVIHELCVRRHRMPGLLKAPSSIAGCTSAGKADAFNGCFHSILLVLFVQLPLSCAPIIPALNIQQEEVRRKLSLLNPSKSSGQDNIPTRPLKEGASEAAPSPANVFQLSLHLEQVPSVWKDANVIPLHKYGHKSVVKKHTDISGGKDSSSALV